MHAGGDCQAHRIAQSWQLANLIRSGAAKGRYVICVRETPACDIVYKSADEADW
jgi:hypothetical protein